MSVSSPQSNWPDWVRVDQAHVWHPYSAMDSGMPVFPVRAAHGVTIELADGRQLIDGMSSWWCAIHGYNHPQLNRAVTQQLSAMSHVMFGGLTHEPAAQLAEKLVALTPQPLQTVFFADSGSVSVEVAMKMAIQYQHSIGQPQRRKFLTLRRGYHGDTFGAMSVCDPVTGMHGLFGDTLMQQVFVPEPEAGFDQEPTAAELEQYQSMLKQHAGELAAVILEPVVQGAGGMRFYSPLYLQHFRRWCDELGLLLIADEIATGFGRSGRLFACEHAGISPDILCVGKALTGGYMTLAATLTTREVSCAVSEGEPGVFMHGPTFMANPLACAVALASIELLLASDWQAKVKQIEQLLEEGLRPCAQLNTVSDVRVLGAIGVVEMKQPVDMRKLPEAFVNEGIWVRPFGRLVYLMPPFIIDEEQMNTLTSGLCRVLQSEANQ